jgi:hypothetical protein
MTLKRFLQILFTDLPYRWARRLSLILIPAFIFAVCGNVLWVTVLYVENPWLFALCLGVGEIVMILLSVFLAERMYRISYAEELRILGYQVRAEGWPRN